MLARSPAALAGALALVVLASADARAQVPSFTGVGDLPGGAVESSLLAISADGQTAVGQSASASGPEAVRWTAGGGLQGLGFLSGANPESAAKAVSADGAVVAGTSLDAGGVPRAFRHAGSGLTALGRFGCADCEPVTEGLGLSGNGLVVVGSAVARSTGPVHLDPVRWPGGGTAIQDLGNLPAPNEAGQAFGASFDGAVLAGEHSSHDGQDAWVWTAGPGLVALPRLAGAPVAATAFAVSGDASAIVGTSNAATFTLPGGTVVPSEPQAVRWTGAGYGTIESLGSIPGAPYTDSAALAVSPDGSVVVGRAVDENGSERAFLWDAALGMRKLESALAEEYGLDLGGWVLTEALGVSALVDGAFFVVGNGVNPSGDPEGWVAFLTAPPCSNGEDDDLDGDVDFPDDAGCRSPADHSEAFDCADGLDNDGDGDVDFPAEAGCRSADDPSEELDCADGLDNDGDGQTDFPADAGCFDADWPLEDPACANGIDDDGDTLSDFPADPECVRPSDLSESADCSDGLDNDGDGQVDHPADAECDSPADLSENPACSDGVDNDGDGRSDYPAQYPGCTGPDDASEAPQCSDGEDNDGDGDIDFPADASCSASGDANEDPFVPGAAGLLVVDRSSRALFFVDASSGAQTLVSQGARLLAPQGVALGAGSAWVADPAGLFEVSWSGEQRAASPPLAAGDSLQVLIDGAGDPYVLEAERIARVDGAAGQGTLTPWLVLPIWPELLVWAGDAMVLDAAGDFLVSGQGFAGDGVMRVDATTQDVSVLDPAFEGRAWVDLALEPDGNVIAVGVDVAEGPGVYRVDPVDGSHVRVDADHPWQQLSGVAVDANGDIFAADAGLCSESGSCSGSAILRVDPVDGSVTPLTSGGFLAGPLDPTVLPEPGAGRGAALAALLAWALARRRRGSRGS